MRASSRVVVLGSCGAWPEAGRASSGFVVEHEGARVVVDLGYGTLPRLLAHLDDHTARAIDAVVITHHHADHCIDLHGLMRARWFGAEGREPDLPALPLVAPAGVITLLEAVEHGQDPQQVRRIFDWQPSPGGPYEVGPFQVITRPVPHYVPAVAVRLEAPGLVVAFTGDSAPDDALVAIARDAELLVAQASVATKDGPTGDQLFLSAEDAGRLATAAGARRLLLVHFFPGTDRREQLAAARAHFEGEIVLADEGLVVDLA